MDALSGIEVVTLAPNVPGPVAAARLRDLGARVTKIEAPAGDPLARTAPHWYEALHRNCTVVSIDLKAAAGRASLEELLAGADVLLTSSRPTALERLGLGWDELHARHPELLHVAIVGYPPPHEERTGHDLNYVSELGLVEPPALPRTLIADLAGAERAVSATLAALFRRARGGAATREFVSLREAASVFAEPLVHGMTGQAGILGGAAAIYRFYRAQAGWVAVGALEPHFVTRLGEALGVDPLDADALIRAFAERDAATWEAWGNEHDVPVSAVSELLTEA
jgi:crotonobetainyl-CoA:carnitine CoA-transferase CaiB-like acyl-CoA transferase